MEIDLNSLNQFREIQNCFMNQFLNCFFYHFYGAKVYKPANQTQQPGEE